MIFIYKIYKNILKNYDEMAGITQEKLNLPYFQCGPQYSASASMSAATIYFSSNNVNTFSQM